ncbi:hypothetical protein BCR44DRAFT_1208690 [Catenaria anguillulae PL171]|uniref:Uncharacterized protein n=1 Tax=Catenaria anguillulae PL171 TaxID=765915 RepID=A0A1Y2HJC1_9FUNG|nr:hypothetical protein BCR44DRAFT_1208690 [Catenaria anguillulae PL171]
MEIMTANASRIVGRHSTKLWANSFPSPTTNLGPTRFSIPVEPRTMPDPPAVATATATTAKPEPKPNTNPNANRRQTGGGIQVSSRYLASASSSSSSSTATANPRKRPASQVKPPSSSADRALAPASKRARKSTAPAAIPKTPRKKSLAPAQASSTAVTPRRRATVGPTGSSAVDRELLQLAASIRTRAGATAAADSTTRPGPTASSNPIAPRSARKTTGAAAAPASASRKSTAAPTSRKSSKPATSSSASTSSSAPPALSPIPLDPSWTDANTHSLHRLLQWTYLTTSTLATHAADHADLQSHLTRAANLIDMRTHMLGAVRDRVTWEHAISKLDAVRAQAQRVSELVDRILADQPGFCAAHARVVRAVQAGVDLVELPEGARVSDVDEFVAQVKVAGLAMERIVRALDADAVRF